MLTMKDKVADAVSKAVYGPKDDDLMESLRAIVTQVAERSFEAGRAFERAIHDEQAKRARQSEGAPF